MIFFHVENRTFQVAAETSGVFPEKASWYQAFSSPSSHGLVSLRVQASPSHGQTATPAGGSLGAGSQSLLSPVPSVVFCTWLPRANKFISPEFYQYLLPPEEKVSCLNLQEKIWDLDLDLQRFVAVGGRYFLLGYAEAEEDAPAEDVVYNVCVEIVACRENMVGCGVPSCFVFSTYGMSIIRILEPQFLIPIL
jgi:hypothetical protein